MTEPLVVAEDLCLRYTAVRPLHWLTRRPLSAVEVLNGVSFQVNRGEFFALLGRNGAGKTTVLKIIASLLWPRSGHARVAGYDVVANSRQVRQHTGYVLADERSFQWRLSARENLEFFAALNDMRGVEARRRIRMLLDRLDLGTVANQPFRELSTGMKQRLAIARAMLVRPQVVLLDEPTRSIDVVHAAEVWQLLKEEVQDCEGCAILVTHQIQEATAQCSRIALLESGRVMLNTTAAHIEQMTTELDGYTLSVRGLSATALEELRSFPGVRDIRVASRVGGMQLLEVWSRDSNLPLAGFLGELMQTGATLCTLQRGVPLLGVLERLSAMDREISV